jgi:hypothetical protein
VRVTNTINGGPPEKKLLMLYHIFC